VVNPGEGVVGRVRRLRGSYGAPGREGEKRIASAVVRLWVAGRRSGQAIVARGIGLFPLAAAATALIAPRGRRDGSGLHRSTAGVRQVVATIDGRSRQAGDRYTLSKQTPRPAAVASPMGHKRTPKAR
jgi:hypothetical protein